MRMVGRAELLELELQRHVGTSWGELTLDHITLISPREAWPPVFRLDYTYEGEKHVEEEAWDDDHNMAVSVPLWLGVTYAHFAERGMA